MLYIKFCLLLVAIVTLPFLLSAKQGLEFIYIGIILVSLMLFYFL